MKVLKYLLVVVTLSISPMLYATDVFVSHYEPLQSIAVHAADKTSANVGQKLQPSEPAVLRFEAMGKTFDLNLVANDRLLGAMPADAAFEGIYAYRGSLADNPDSWVRIVMFDEMPRGLIWDGATMFAIEAPGDSAVEISSPVIYRLSDLNIAPGTMQCGAKSISGNAAQIFASMKAEIGPVISAAPGAVSEITMSVIGDSSFTNAQGGDAAAAAAITTRFNNVDGYFSEQVGIQLDVQLIETHDNASDPFDGTLDHGDLLDQLSQYRLQTSAHNSRGLTHLYTGRNFATTTVGVAWRGALCDSFLSAGLSEGRAGAITDSLIAAHEIGHNFGAEHDGQPGSSCESEPETFIMAPSVNGNNQFSACSISVMQAEAAAASCVVALPTVDVGIRQNGQASTVLLGASTVINYEVSVNGTLPVNNVVADFTVPSVLALDSVTVSSGTCTSGAGTVSCALGDLAGLSSHTIDIATTPINVGVGMLNATVTTVDSDERPTNDQDSLQLTVNPAVDLVVTTPAPAPVFVDTSTTIIATLENRSILQATNLSLSVSLDSGLQADTASWSIGTCNVTAQQIDCQANSLGAQSSSSLSITATATSTGMKNVTIDLTSAEADANTANNSASGGVNVLTPREENDDEGGGTTSPLFLLAMVVAGLLRRRLKSLS
jgi:hypothetical protein